MAARTFTSSIHSTFPVGTLVEAHRDPGAGLTDKAPATGGAVASGTVDASGLSLSGLTSGSAYVLYATVAGKARFVRFRQPVAGTTPTTWKDVTSQGPSVSTASRKRWPDVVASRRAAAGTS